MPLNKNSNKTDPENLICLRALTAREIAKMQTYNYSGFVGSVVKKGELYVVTEITGRPNIVGSGETVEEALLAFEASVRGVLRETCENSQRKMLMRRFAKTEALHSRINAINQTALKRRVDHAQRMENRD